MNYAESDDDDDEDVFAAMEAAQSRRRNRQRQRVANDDDDEDDYEEPKDVDAGDDDGKLDRVCRRFVKTGSFTNENDYMQMRWPTSSSLMNLTPQPKRGSVPPSHNLRAKGPRPCRPLPDRQWRN